MPGSSATILNKALGYPRYLGRKLRMPYAGWRNLSVMKQSGKREKSSRHAPIVWVTIDTALYIIKIQTSNLVENPAQCSDDLELMSELQVGYFRIGLVLPASCFSRRVCVRCALESLFLFFIFIDLFIISVTPF